MTVLYAGVNMDVNIMCCWLCSHITITGEHKLTTKKDSEKSNLKNIILGVGGTSSRSLLETGI